MNTRSNRIQIVSENLSDIKVMALSWKEKNEVVGFIPTMGNLHEGHLSLIRKIRDYGATKTIVSIDLKRTVAYRNNPADQPFLL